MKEVPFNFTFFSFLLRSSHRMMAAGLALRFSFITAVTLGANEWGDYKLDGPPTINNTGLFGVLSFVKGMRTFFPLSPCSRLLAR